MKPEHKGPKPVPKSAAPVNSAIAVFLSMSMSDEAIDHDVLRLSNTFGMVNVTHYTTHHGRESTTPDPGEETGKKHAWIRTSDGTAELTQNKQYTSRDEDGFSPVDLGERSQDHGCRREAGGEGRDPYIDGGLTDAPVVRHLLTWGAVGAGSVSSRQGDRTRERCRKGLAGIGPSEWGDVVC